MTAREVTDIVLTLAPLDGQIKGDLNGLLYGDGDTVVTGVAVCWTPSAVVIRHAAAEGLNYILSHQPMFFLQGESEWYATMPEAKRPQNILRRRLLDCHGMVHCRCHSNWDAVADYGTADACALALEFPEPSYRSRYLRLYEVPPQSLGELAQWCKLRLGASHVRVAGDLARTISRVGIACSGVNPSWECLDEFILQDADAVIIGEGTDDTFRAALDAGLGLVETSHIACENPGMREFARLLADKLPNLSVQFIDAGPPWVLR